LNARWSSLTPYLCAPQHINGFRCGRAESELQWSQRAKIQRARPARPVPS
jgi:hypothetical protein